MHDQFDGSDEIAGYVMQEDNIRDTTGAHIKRPQDAPFFLFRFGGSWGFSPHPKQWSHFQNWFNKVCPHQKCLMKPLLHIDKRRKNIYLHDEYFNKSVDHPF